MAEKSRAGGRRPGAGRPRGSKNSRTAEIARAAAAKGITPLEFMLNLMRTELPVESSALEKASMRSLQFEAAKAAAPYVHPKLANIEHGNADGKPFEIVLHSQDDKL